MSDWDDLDDVTPRISNEDAERLLSGTPGIDGAPALADLSTVVSALRGPAEPAELTGLHSALAAFGAAVVTAQSAPPTAKTRPMVKKLLTGKALAAIGVVTLASASAAAAAGVVPTPFSSKTPIATSSANDDPTDDTILDTVVDTVIDTTPTTDETKATDPPPPPPAAASSAVAPADDAAEAADADASVETDGRGPDVNGPAKFGLCTAYAARTKHEDDRDLPVPFQALSDAAEAAGQTVAEFCADAVPGGGAEAPGHDGDNPSATAPGHAGDNPSATAPGHADDKPGKDKGKSGEDHGKPDTTQP